MSDLISRQEALDTLSAFVNMDEYYHGRKCENIPMLNAKRYLENAPSADPEQKKGKWKVHLYELGRERYECSECAGRCDLEYDFCPNCGADMRGENGKA